MKTNVTLAWQYAAMLLAFILVSATAQAQISMGTRQNTYTQNFDGLPSAGKATWKSGKEYLPGMVVYRTKNDSIITANNGQANTGGLYSYGATGSTDRALGSLASTNAGIFTYNLLLQNNTGNSIKSIEVAYTGEQWRISNSTAPQHVISFWYAITSDPSTVSTLPTNDKGWTEVSELKFYGPKFFLNGGPLNGNAPDNRALLQRNLQLDIPAGYYLMLRWKDADEPEADHGLAIDDVTITWHAQPVEMPTPLPVELVYLKARTIAEQVELQWQTASEEQNSHFVVERSPDGKAFEGIGMVAGNGTTVLKSDYSYLDQLPLAGTSYYRLKQVDEDGTYTFSKVVSVTRKISQEVSIYPTITTKELQVRTSLRLQQAIVVDVMGRKLLEQQLQSTIKYLLDVSRLENGAYVLVLLDETGRKHVRRFVKQ